MGTKDTGLLVEHGLEHTLEDLLAHFGIQSRDRVVHQDDILVLVDGSSQSNTRFLTSRQVDTLLTNLSEVASLEALEVLLEAASDDSLDVAGFIHGLFEENVISNGLVADPGSLLAVRERSSLHNRGLLGFNWLLEEGGLEVNEFFIRLGRLKASEVFNVFVRDGNHITDDGLQETGLATGGLTNDAHELAFLNLDVHTLKGHPLSNGLLVLFVLLLYSLGVGGLLLVGLSVFLLVDEAPGEVALHFKSRLPPSRVFSLHHAVLDFSQHVALLDFSHGASGIANVPHEVGQHVKGPVKPVHAPITVEDTTGCDGGATEIANSDDGGLHHSTNGSVDVPVQHVLEFTKSDEGLLLFTTLDDAFLEDVSPGVELEGLDVLEGLADLSITCIVSLAALLPGLLTPLGRV